MVDHPWRWITLEDTFALKAAASSTSKTGLMWSAEYFHQVVIKHTVLVKDSRSRANLFVRRCTSMWSTTLQGCMLSKSIAMLCRTAVVAWPHLGRTKTPSTVHFCEQHCTRILRIRTPSFPLNIATMELSSTSSICLDLFLSRIIVMHCHLICGLHLVLPT